MSEFAVPANTPPCLKGGALPDTTTKAQISNPQDARIVTRAAPSLNRQLFGLGDLLALCVLAATPIASMLPARQLRAAAVRMAGLLPAGFRQEASLETFIDFGGLSRDEAAALRRCQLAEKLTSLAFFIKQLGGNPVYEIAVEGREHVTEALAGGRGAVIWIADFVFASEVVRQAFHALGHPLTHVIRPEHGFSSTRFGVRCLNPVHMKVGKRHVREFVVFDRDRPDDARRRLERRLGENGLISLLACAYEGRTLVRTPFMRGELDLAIGAPALAFKMGCPILPVFIRRSPAAPRFTVSIGGPLKMSGTDRRAAIVEAAKDFVARLSPCVEANPELWRGWSSLTEWASQPFGDNVPVP
jgi:lauroyl/myristoyl acyltransferase